MAWIWDLLFLATGIVLILDLMLRGLIPFRFGVFALMGLVFFRAIARSRGGHLGHLIRTALAVGIPIASLSLFAIKYGNGDPAQMTAIVGGIALLSIVLFGFYLMVRGASVRRKGRF